MITSGETEKPSKKDGHPERYVEAEVPVDLTDSELSARADTLAQLVLQEAELKLKRKAASADFNEKIKENVESQKKLAEERQSKQAKVTMQCIEVREYPRRVVVYRCDLKLPRSDPRMVVSERPLSAEELQTPLFDPEKPETGSSDVEEGSGGDDGGGKKGGKGAKKGGKKPSKPPGGPTLT